MTEQEKARSVAATRRL